MGAILEVAGLVRRFGGIVVADAIDFEIRTGEVVGLIGPNGAGKTTLFNLMTGFVAPDSGSISFQGRRIERLPPYRRAQLGIARTWQSPRLFPSLSIIDNLLIADRDYPGGSLYQSIFRRAQVAASGAAARRRATRAARTRGARAARQLDVDAALARPAEARGAGARADERRHLPAAR